MHKISIASIALFASLVSLADRSSSFGINAYNIARSTAKGKSSFAFSPLGFEYDCAVLAEAFDSIGRANIAETIGVLSDFQSAYDPIREFFDNASATNRVEFLSARAICVRDPSTADKEYRRRIIELNGASVCPAWPSIGVERWVKAKMDGHMEDFIMPTLKLSNAGGYGVVDANYIGAEFPDGVNVEDLEADFSTPSGKKKIAFRKISTNAVYRYDDGILSLKLPLKGGADLYIFTTTNEKPLSEVAKLLTGDNIRSVFYNLENEEDRGAKEAYFDLVLPKIDFAASCSLEKAFDYARVAETGFMSLDKTLRKRISQHTVRVEIKPAPFRHPEEPKVEEKTKGKSRSAKKDEAPEKKEPPKKATRIVIDRPFVFLIHVGEFDVLPVAGEFTGL